MNAIWVSSESNRALFCVVALFIDATMLRMASDRDAEGLEQAPESEKAQAGT